MEERKTEHGGEETKGGGGGGDQINSRKLLDKERRRRKAKEALTGQVRRKVEGRMRGGKCWLTIDTAKSGRGIGERKSKKKTWKDDAQDGQTAG